MTYLYISVFAPIPSTPICPHLPLLAMSLTAPTVSLAQQVSLYIPICIYHVPICPCLSLLCILPLSLYIYFCNCPFLSVYFPCPYLFIYVPYLSLSVFLSLYLSVPASTHIPSVPTTYSHMSLHRPFLFLHIPKSP